MRLFTGHDARESVGWHVFVQSLIETSADYVLMPPLSGVQGNGSNAFTYSRFLVPQLCNHAGHAIFVDGSDMLLRADIRELWDMRDSSKAIQVVKHNYKTKHPRKYIGVELESENRDYPRKNWGSVVIFNAGHKSHFDHLHDIQHAIENFDGEYLHRFGWLDPDEIGELPADWNHVIGELPANPQAKIAHFSLGLPCFDYYADCEFAEEWRATASRAMRGMQYDFQMPSRR